MEPIRSQSLSAASTRTKSIRRLHGHQDGRNLLEAIAQFKARGSLFQAQASSKILLKSAVESGIRSDFMARGFIALTAISCGKKKKVGIVLP